MWIIHLRHTRLFLQNVPPCSFLDPQSDWFAYSESQKDQIGTSLSPCVSLGSRPITSSLSLKITKCNYIDFKEITTETASDVVEYRVTEDSSHIICVSGDSGCTPAFMHIDWEVYLNDHVEWHKYWEILVWNKSTSMKNTMHLWFKHMNESSDWKALDGNGYFT